MGKLHQEAHAALGRLMHSDEITDAHAVEIQDFTLRMHGMMREVRDAAEAADPRCTSCMQIPINNVCACTHVENQES